jgi:BirA family biotin operon repressor/biotin-[acetyl-CoA-carboxylase] ligase
VAGVAVVGSLADRGVDGLALKWPNDIMGGGGKVGGILVEVAGEAGGPLRAVIGIGLNVRPVPGISAALRDDGSSAAPVGLDELSSEGSLERNVLVASLLNGLYASLRSFSRGGGDDFLDSWRRYDYLAGRPVVVTSGRDVLKGTARGIADNGALLVETAGRVVPVVAGDVTLRVPERASPAEGV